MLNIDDLLQTDRPRGVVNILAADRLMQAPQLYATLLLWLLSELYEKLPEVGDPDKPKLVFFFDEAHLLFTDAPKILLDKIEQVVRLIRSKGVGVYFVTQNPLDVPDIVLGQLGNRVQHALRAFTPRDQKAVKTAATTMRANPKIDTEKAITELGVGEALVSFLDEKGRPNPVERAYVLPPASRIGPITPEERRADRRRVAGEGRYEKVVDRESAYEKLKGRASAAPDIAGGRHRGGATGGSAGGGFWDSIKGSLGGLVTGSGPQGQHRRGDGEERGANGRLDGRPRDRARRAGVAARRGEAGANARRARRPTRSAPPRAAPSPASRSCSGVIAMRRLAAKLLCESGSSAAATRLPSGCASVT